jgi:ribonucleoside-diphosphate reductase alpha chain
VSRERLPDRRHSFTQKVRIDGQTFFVTFGEYADGRLGEIFIDGRHEGTFLRGVLGALARMASLALQNGVPTSEVVRSLRGLDFPPCGAVAGSAAVTSASSVADYIAQEIEAAYLRPRADQVDTSAEPPADPPPAVPEKTISFVEQGHGH